MERDLSNIKEDVRARSDIVEVVGLYVRLQRAGKNWKGLCPFHNDKNPSFNISPALQIYKCYSCGEYGDVFTFVQKKENLDFVGTLEFLARRAGIPFERKALNPEQASEREQMFELNALAVRFYQDRLHKSPVAQDYLAGRAVLKETQEKFQIGFAPDDWEGLTYYLQQRRADMALAAKVGLIKVRSQEGSGYYDAFRNRLMFPIHDMSGRVIAFGGRAMDDNPAKYLNSENSPLFVKSRTLYGLCFANKKISGDTPAVFVEGYMDVVATHQAGFAQCVATLGTSMTEEHAQLLVKKNPRVIICYDADAAGVKATLRGASVWEAVGVAGAEVRVARLPTGDDPDSLLRRGDTAAFQTALDNAVPRVDFMIELTLKAHDLHTEAGRDAALAEVIPILASIPTAAARARHVQRLAHLHPLQAHMGISQAIRQMLLDVETYARQARNSPSARDRGYPLTEAANRAPLTEQPPPPAYRPPSQKDWGASGWPMTRQVIRKGEGGNTQDYGRGDYRNKRQKGPVGDPTPPPLNAPALTGAEKAERQLLRALFGAEWRATILSQLPSELLVTAEGRLLFAWIARTPANAEGEIDPLPLLHQAEAEEAQGDATTVAAASPERRTLKLSQYIRDLLEDSPFLVSNEHLNEAAVSDCILRLRRHRESQTQRALAERLQHLESMSPEEQRAYIQQFHQKMRETRGSAPAAEGG
jgi:DNA primase